VLHHGSLVLRRPALTPFVAAAEDAVAVDESTVERLRAALANRLAAALGAVPLPGSLTAGERALAERLRAGRYVDRAFTYR
jgi:hypothetical protein